MPDLFTLQVSGRMIRWWEQVKLNLVSNNLAPSSTTPHLLTPLLLLDF